MRKKYIIDGFNFGYKVPEIARWLKAGETDRAIQLIINRVQQIFLPKSEQIILVFDGKYSASSIATYVSKIEVKFSNKPQTADDIIRNFIRNCKTPEFWTVVSSDSEIRNTALAMGSRVEKSEDRAKQQRTNKKNVDKSINEKYNPNAVDVDYWLDLFRSGDDH